MLSWWLEPSLHSVTINFYYCYYEYYYFYWGQHATLTSCGWGNPLRLCWSKRASQRKEGPFERSFEGHVKADLVQEQGNTVQSDDAIWAKAVWWTRACHVNGPARSVGMTWICVSGDGRNRDLNLSQGQSCISFYVILRSSGFSLKRKESLKYTKLK